MTQPDVHLLCVLWKSESATWLSAGGPTIDMRSGKSHMSLK